jgi:hypothetical protein
MHYHKDKTSRCRRTLMYINIQMSPVAPSRTELLQIWHHDIPVWGTDNVNNQYTLVYEERRPVMSRMLIPNRERPHTHPTCQHGVAP